DGLSLAARAHLRSETSWSVGHLDRDITRDEQALGPIDPTVPATPEQLENLVFLEEYVSDAERSACSVGVHEDAPAYPVGEEAEMRAGNTPAPSVNSAAGRRGRDIFLTFRARGCGPHGSRLVRPAPRASPQPSHLWSEPTHVTTGKQPPKAASRWLLVQSRGRRWSFPFIVGEHEVVVAGSSPTANLPLRGSAPLSFYVKDVSVGLR